VSCPDLRDTPYTAAKINSQLDEQAKKLALPDFVG